MHMLGQAELPSQGRARRLGGCLAEVLVKGSGSHQGADLRGRASPAVRGRLVRICAVVGCVGAERGGVRRRFAGQIDRDARWPLCNRCPMTNESVIPSEQVFPSC